MTRHEEALEPRCSGCTTVLLAPGAICHVCHIEQHFEGVPRTAPRLDRIERSSAARAS